MKRVMILGLIVLLLISASCSEISNNKVHNVGLLVEGTIHDQTWGKSGYLGLLKIKEELGVDVFFKEGIDSQFAVNAAVEEFSNNDVNLIFGHSNVFGKYFSKIHDQYPDIRFVYFNGITHDDNITSMNFNSHAMGFFAGMVASAMTTTNHLGVIGTFSWQQEIDGFYEGAKYQNPNVKVSIQYVNSWDDIDRALEIYDQLKQNNVDVFYPTGDSYTIPVINAIKEDGHFAIGYVTDQIEIGKSTILTSTIQHVDRLYLKAAQLMESGELSGEILEFDFKEGVITLGTFSELVPNQVQQEVQHAVERYIETGKLPNEIK